jgi:NADH dehydrogenase [ubiquinone] 1 alpha subcomplex assembly factor 7
MADPPVTAERLDAFMARANAAYYATQDPFADFTTSPEISQVFGEILGLWAAVTWQLLGSPSPVMLVEAGPGRGTLMADALRAVSQAMPAFRAASTVHFVETSPRLRLEQATRVPDAVWHDDLSSVPAGPMILLANEFLDALPIRQFVRREDGWKERFVGEEGFEEMRLGADGSDGDKINEISTPPPLEGGGWGKGYRGTYGGVSTPPPNPLNKAADPPEGTIREFNESALTFTRALAARFLKHPGAALFLDYGPEHSNFGDSLQALTGGKPADPLSPPGTADLTAHVDFAALAAAARAAGASVQGPVAQGFFLAELGLFQRSNRLARSLPPARAAAVMDAARRLGEPDRMGRLFKALAVGSAGCPGLPGFGG